MIIVLRIVSRPGDTRRNEGDEVRGDVGVGVEGDGNHLAVRAHDLGFQLALKQVHNQTLSRGDRFLYDFNHFLNGLNQK